MVTRVPIGVKLLILNTRPRFNRLIYLLTSVLGFRNANTVLLRVQTPRFMNERKYWIFVFYRIFEADSNAPNFLSPKPQNLLQPKRLQL